MARGRSHALVPLPPRIAIHPLKWPAPWLLTLPPGFSKSSYYVLLSAKNFLPLFAVMHSIGIPRFNCEF
jgi:hypothetical protein